MTRVKICGITNVDDARCAAEAGADFLGFVFYPPSPRCVTPERAAMIVRAIRRERGAEAPRFVGVFVNAPATGVRAILDGVGLDLAQLHGDEPPAEIRALHPRAFKALRPQTRAEAEAAVAAYGDAVPPAGAIAAPQFLVDAYHPAQFGGTGIPADLVVARSLAQRFRLLLAGGLTPETVGAAIAVVGPWGVDVSSGVERAKGVKDHARVRAFIQAVRAADAAGASGPEIVEDPRIQQGER
jgi:phosphoribosylanthranilate isomerase